ncbi:MAG: heme-copper oxidase subunit III [Bacteroidota bacterium]|jgi:cytochrome c oxidase subunit 3|nr:cytochrome c oxidase subunit 3 [Flammeovirgaceae bacterium]MCZ8069048.1 cytochrome c oxidase subunit 3 [Cytophagales bacterium]
MNEAVDFKIVEEPKKPIAMHPKKFGLWLFMASVFILFMAFTSAYIVRRAEGNWQIFELPALFTYSTIVILLSSVTMQWTYFAVKRNQLANAKNMIVLTSVAGVIFLALQWMGWGSLIESSIHLVGNPSGSFLYIITGLHAAHIISAIVFLLVVLANALRNRFNLNQLEMCTTYWHFLGVLWLYLFVFLTLLR